MQIVVNDRFVRRESRLAAIMLGVTFALLGAGLFFSLQLDQRSRAEGGDPSTDPMLIVVPYAIVIVGMVLYYLGNTRMRRFGPQYRQDGRLRQLLKGLDDRYSLYTFLGSKLPDYILVGPSGVFVLIPRLQAGEITCRDDRWSRRGSGLSKVFSAMYGNPLGSPSYDAQQGVRRVEAFLSERLPADIEQPPISGLVVFTAEQVRLRTERCRFQATTGKELRRLLGKLRGKLNANQVAQTRAALDAVLAA